MKQWVFAYCICYIVISSSSAISAYLRPKLVKVCICSRWFCKILCYQSVLNTSDNTYESANIAYGICEFAYNAISITNAVDITDLAGTGKNLSMIYSIHYKSMYLLEEIIINLQMHY